MQPMVVRRIAAGITSRVIDLVRLEANHRGTFTEKELSMSMFDSPRFLRNVLAVDSASCIATGALQIVFTNTLADLTQLPAPLLQATGWFLLAYAAVVGFIATREPIPRGFVWIFVAGNFGWAAACAALLVSRSVHATLLGEAWIVAQAVTVVVLAELQWMGLRRSRPIGWA